MEFLSAPQTQAEHLRDALLSALIGLARATVNEPKSEDTDRILRTGLTLLAKPEAEEPAIERMERIVKAEKLRIAPNCATCTMRCGNTDDYDMTRLWSAPEALRTLKLRLLHGLLELAQAAPSEETQAMIDQGLFVLAEDWDEELLAPVVQKAERLCGV